MEGNHRARGSAIDLRRVASIVLMLAPLMLSGAALAAPTPEDAKSVVIPAKAPVHKEETFSFFPTDVIMATNWGEWGPGMRVPQSVELLTDPSLRGSAMFVFKIRDASGKIVGFGSQQEVYDFDRAGKPTGMWTTAYTITIPGRGTLFLSQIEQGLSLLEKIKFPKDGSSWKGSATAQTTIGPRPDGRGVIVGGSGEFAGRKGTFVEVDHAVEMDPKMKEMPKILEKVRLVYE